MNGDGEVEVADDWNEVYGDLADYHLIVEGWRAFWMNTEVERFVYEEMPDGSKVLVDTVRTDKPRQKPPTSCDIKKA